MNSFSVWLSVFSIVVGVIGVCLAIFFERRRRTKLLTYQIPVSAPLLRQTTHSDDAALAGITVSVDGVPVKDPRTVVVIVTNTGNTEIRRDDYDEDLSLSLGPATVVSSVVSLVPRGGLDRRILTAITVTDHSITMPPPLLNPGDRLEFHTLVDGDPEISLMARFAGGSLRTRPLSPETTSAPSGERNRLVFAEAFVIASIPALTTAAAVLWAASTGNLPDVSTSR